MITIHNAEETLAKVNDRISSLEEEWDRQTALRAALTIESLMKPDPVDLTALEFFERLKLDAFLQAFFLNLEDVGLKFESGPHDERLREQISQGTRISNPDAETEYLAKLDSGGSVPNLSQYIRSDQVHDLMERVVKTLGGGNSSSSQGEVSNSPNISSASLNVDASASSETTHVSSADFSISDSGKNLQNETTARWVINPLEKNEELQSELIRTLRESIELFTTSNSLNSNAALDEVDRANIIDLLRSLIGILEQPLLAVEPIKDGVSVGKKLRDRMLEEAVDHGSKKTVEGAFGWLEKVPELLDNLPALLDKWPF